MAYQTRDNVDVLIASGNALPALKVDGGASRSDLLCQFQADILGLPVMRPTELERTALGVAQVAGLAAGLWTKDDVRSHWITDRVFEPSMSADHRAELYAGWQRAVRSVVRQG
jgi:glycerol kinase